MRKRTRLLGVGAIAIVSALSMAACAPTEQNAGGPEPVVFWGSWSGDQVAQLDEQAAAFNASQDEYEVTYVPQELVEEKLLTAIAGGQVPDVILWDRPATMTYAPKGALASIDELVARDGVDLDGFYEQALNEMYSRDKLYGLPLLVDNRSLFYNKTLLTEAGVTPPTNWDELKTAAEALTVREGGILTRSGFGLNDPGLFASWLRQAGGTMLNDDQTEVAFNSPEGLEVLAFWKSLLDAGVYEQGFGDGIDAFAQSSMAMKFDGPWALSGLDQTDVDYGIVPPPAGPNGDQGAGMGGFGLVIAEGAKNPEGAWAFMKWWTTQPENGVGFAKIAGWIPANIEAANDPYFTENDHYSAFVETLGFAQTRPQVPGYSDVEGLALIPSLQKFLSGEMTAEAALAEAETLSNQILADNR